MKSLGARGGSTSISSKLQLISLATTGVALLTFFLISVVNQFGIYSQALESRIASQARLLAVTLAPELSSGSLASAVNLLQDFQASIEVSTASVIRADGVEFARFERQKTLSRPAIALLFERWNIQTIPKELIVIRDILSGGRVIGTLVVHAELSSVYLELWHYSALTLSSAFFALALAALMVNRLNRSVTEPLAVLTRLMRHVAAHQDYGVRADVQGNDEVGELARCFNTMLSRIAAHDDTLTTELMERRKAEEKLDHLAHYDPVTDLLNRNSFNDRLEEVVERGNRTGGRVGVMFIDLDNFKIINDTLGHHVGDLLLSEVGQRLLWVLRRKEPVFRIGGDEFAVILENPGDRRNIELVAEKIIQSFAIPFTFESHAIPISATIGVSFFPDDAVDMHALLKCADTALYHAKEKGKNTFRFFQPEMKGKAVKRLKLEIELRRALENDEFVLHYQPQFDLKAGRIFAVEALVRWQHPKLGLIGPAEFIPVAEDSGLIIPLGDWVLRAATEQAAIWEKQLAEHRPPLTVAVNLSARQMHDDHLSERVLQPILESGLNPSLLELELTESTLMDGSSTTLRKLSELRNTRIRLAIDDFGTGYSCLGYLKRFKVNTLKIDLSFVRGIPNDPSDCAIVRAIIALGQSLGTELIAEGVESREQAEFLRANGCSKIQGFLFSKPLDSNDMTLLLMESKPRLMRELQMY